MKKNRRIIPNLILLLFSVLVALGMGELLVRVLAPQQLTIIRNGIWGPDDRLIFKKKPHVNEKINVGEGVVHLITDGSGYRINRPENQPKDCPKKVLFLGDSFLEALQVENEDIYPERLRALMQEKHGSDFCAVNTGVGRYNPVHYYLVAQHELERDSYDMVVAGIYVGNDFVMKFDTVLAPEQPMKRHSLKWPDNWTKEEIRTSWIMPVRNWLSSWSHLWVLVRNTEETYYTRALNANRIRRFHGINSKANWRETMLTCKQIQSVADRKNIPALFLLLPAPFQIDHDVFHEFLGKAGIPADSVDIELPNKHFSKLMRDEGMILLDAYPYFREKHAASVAQYGSVDRHFSKQGHISMAEFAFPVFDSLLNK